MATPSAWFVDDEGEHHVDLVLRDGSTWYSVMEPLLTLTLLRRLTR
jgi:hypothetical protein